MDNKEEGEEAEESDDNDDDDEDEDGEDNKNIMPTPKKKLPVKAAIASPQKKKQAVKMNSVVSLAEGKEVVLQDCRSILC